MRVEGEGVMIDEMGANVSIGRCWSVYKFAGVWVGPVPSFIVKGTHNNQRQSRWSRTLSISSSCLLEVRGREVSGRGLGELTLLECDLLYGAVITNTFGRQNVLNLSGP